jgi:hypothetical protein
MKAPLVVVVDGDVGIFSTVEAASRKIESPEVLDGRCVGYDSEGRLLRLTAPGARRQSFVGVTAYGVNRRIEIDEAEREPTHQDELARVLRDWLKRSGMPLEGDHAHELVQLLEMVVARRGFTR